VSYAAESFSFNIVLRVDFLGPLGEELHCEYEGRSNRCKYSNRTTEAGNTVPRSCMELGAANKAWVYYNVKAGLASIEQV